MTGPHTPAIAALRKALTVLEAFGPDTPDLRLKELAEMTGMTRSSVQRLAETLVRCGYLQRDAQSSALSLTNRNVRMAHAFLSSSHLVDVAVPQLVELSAHTHLRCDLWVMEGADAINVACVPAPTDRFTMAPIGHRMPAGTSAPGRAMLLHAAPPQGRGTAAEGSGRPGQASGQAPEEVAAWGYVVDPGDTSRDEATLATAIHGADGLCIGAISVSGGRRELNDPTRLAEFARQTTATARGVSAIRIQAWPRGTRQPVAIAPTHAPPSEPPEGPLFIQSVARGLRVLEAFTTTTPILRLTDLHRMTGLPIATLQRIVDTLITCTYVEKDIRHKTFRLTARALDPLFKYQMGSRTIKTVWPRLVRLREESGLRCSYCALQGTDIVHLLHVQSHPHSDFRTAFVGRTLPAASTSGGRAILSTFSVEQIDDFLESAPLQRVTPHTLTDKEGLKSLILEARRKGYAFTDQQSILYEVNVAAPVRTPQGRAMGAIVISAPNRDWTVERLEREIVPKLLLYARSIFS